MHHTIEEFNRIGGPDQCRYEVFRRLQRELRDEVQPLLDERDRLLTRVAELEDAVAQARPSPKKAKGSYAEVS